MTPTPDLATLLAAGRLAAAAALIARDLHDRRRPVLQPAA